MKSRIMMIWALLAALLTGTLRAAEAPETLLPDTTWAALVVRDAAALRKQAGKHPLVKLWNDEQVKAFTEPMRKQMAREMDLDQLDQMLQQEFGKSLNDLIELFNGPMVVGITTMPEERSEPGFIFMAGVKDEAAVRDLAKKIEEKNPDATITRQQRRGVELVRVGHDANDDHAGYLAIHNKMVMVSNHKVTAEWAADRMGGAAGQSLSQSPNFAAAVKDAGQSDVLGYVDLQKLLAFAKNMAQQQIGDGEAEMKQVIPGGIKGLFKGLGLDAMRAAYFSMTLAEAHTEMKIALQYSEDVGLMKLIAFEPGVLVKPTFLPANADAMAVSRFSIKRFFKELRELITTVSPFAAGFVEGQIQNINIQTEMDIEKDLIGNLGDDIISATSVRKDAGRPGIQGAISFLMGISLRDRQGFETALNKILALGAGDMLKRRKYLDHEILYIENPMEPGQAAFAYVLTDKWLLASLMGTEALEASLIAMSRGEASPWDRGDIRAAIAQLPPNPQELQVGRLDRLYTMVLQQMITDMGPRAGELFNTDVKLDWDRIGKYFGTSVAGTYKDDKAIRGVFKLLHGTAGQEAR